MRTSRYSHKIGLEGGFDAGQRAKKLMREEMGRRFYRLGQFLGGYLHQDWSVDHETPEKAVDYAIEEYPIEWRQEVRQQLAALLMETSSDPELCDILNDGLNVCVYFRNPIDGRIFAEDIERKLMESIKAHFEREKDRS